MTVLPTYTVLLALIWPLEAYEWPSIVVQRPYECGINQTFNIFSFTCYSCAKGQIPRAEGYGCICPPGSIPASSPSPGVPQSHQCEPCPANHTSTRSGHRCIQCPANRAQCACSEGEITLERAANGSDLAALQCAVCDSSSRPNEDFTACVPCPMFKGKRTCNCTMAGGVCIPPNLGMAEKYTPSPQDGQVESEHSPFFKEHVPVAAYMCLKKHNASACQLLGNLCALTMHDESHPSCGLVKSSLKSRDRNRVEDVPHMYFLSRMPKSITQDEAIPNIYNMRRGNNRLNFTVATYSLRGNLLSMEDNVPATMFQLCNGSFLELDAAFTFGTRYKKNCQIPVHQLISLANQAEPAFYDLYIPFSEGSGKVKESKLYAVPMLLRNYANNMKDDNDKWSFTTRFFMVDGVTWPKRIRYLSKFHLHINMIGTRQQPEKAGRLYPPLAEIEYSMIDLEGEEDDQAQEKEKKVTFEFEVSYKMDMKEAKKDIEIAMGVMSVFAVLWSAKGTWSWSRRSGKMAIDPLTLVKLMALTCGALANVFLTVIFFASLFWFVFFKYQGYLHIMLPNPEQEQLIKHYVISIFALKIVDLIHLLIEQLSVDIFLVDWERPHPLATASNGGRPSAKIEASKEGPPAAGSEASVSVWRTYLVANEWNELQTRRKTHLGLQIILVIFILKVCGVEHVATADPHNRFSLGEGVYSSEPSYICRFALAVCVYLSVALVQAFLWCVVYAAIFEDKLLQFTDVCSLANISVFVMAYNNFGYYIHGKSAHGFADTDMATLIGQLRREAEDFCGHRGLQAGSDDQTFSMSLPGKLRTYYDKIVSPAAQVAAGPSVQQLSGSAAAHLVKAYTTMNQFLTRFLEHALKDLDFEVRDKLFLEKVLDVEFQDAAVADKAIFYSGGIHSFDSVLLYGHELSLTIFDLMIFLFVDLLAQDFLLAGIITFFIGELFKFLRYLGGKSNLAKKTLIDRRFLI